MNEKIFQKMTALLARLKGLNIAKILKIVASLCVAAIIFCLLVDQGVAYYVRDDVYTESDKVPYRPYALVLGTSKYVAKGKLNAYYVNRLDAAKQLYDSKKVDFLLLSGDNRTMQYNEPRTMFRDLRKMNLPENVLYQDFAGFRTLDSVIRAERVFKANSFTVISQQFHCERALLIAKYYDIDAICYAAKQPTISFGTRIREMFARVRAIFDLLIGTKPYFLGSPEPLPTPQPQLELSLPISTDSNASNVTTDSDTDNDINTPAIENPTSESTKMPQAE